MKLTLQFIIEHAETLWCSLRFGKTAYCPYCGSLHVYHGKTRYKCADCGHRFTSRTSTLFHASNLSTATIMTGIYLTITDRGVSSYILAEQLGVTQRTAWSLQTRLRLSLEQYRLCGDEVMVDEVYLGGRVSNMHRKRKYELCRKYEIPLSEEGKMTHSAARAIADRHTKHVLGLADTQKQIYLKYCPTLSRGKAKNLVYDLAPNWQHVTTDESGLYLMFPDEAHSTVCHREHVYVTDEGRTTNPCENMFGWLRGQGEHNHRHCKAKYCQGYLNEFAFRRNHCTVDDRMTVLFGFIRSKRLKLADLKAL